MKAPRYSRSARTITEVQPSYTPAAAEQAKMFDTVKQGFDAGVKFLRPAVEQEQTAIGEQKANEAYEKGSFEMRKPFTIRDQAYNATGERLVTNKAMIMLDEGFRDAMKDANGNMRKLEKNLAELKGQAGELPKIPGLDTRWTETYERGVATARRQTTELAERRAIAAARQAAADAAAAATAETERLALTAGTPEDLTAAITSGVDNLAQFGPRGAFTVNGVEYPADPNRQGTLTPRQIQTQADKLSRDATSLFLRADFERSEAPGEWARNFNESVMSGDTMGMPAGTAFDMAQRFNAAGEARERARLTAEKQAAKDRAAAVADGFAPYVTAAQGGVFAAPTEEERTLMRETVAGNADQLEQLEADLAAADAVVELQALPNGSARVEYIENYQRRALEGGLNLEEAQTIAAITPFLKATRAAITEEIVGVSAGEQLVSSGVMLSDEQLADMRVRAAGNPTVARAVEELAQAHEIINSVDGIENGVVREEILNRLEGELADLAVQGEELGLPAAMRMAGLDLAMQHFEKLGELAKTDPIAFANKQGLEVEPWPVGDDANVASIVGAIASRVQTLAPSTGEYGNDNPVPLSAPEKAAFTEFLEDARPSTRVMAVEGLYKSLPRAQADAVINALGSTQPELKAAARVRESHGSASQIMLAGIGVTVQGDTPTNRAEAEATTLAPFLSEFSAAGRSRIVDDAMAYAKGMAAKGGQTEIQMADLEKGIDIALGADENGDGGIEYDRTYGSMILPTGVTGKSVGRAFKRMNQETMTELFGGGVTDRLGQEYSARELVRTVEGFRPDPTDPGRLLIVDDRGDVFISGNGPASVSIEELLGG